MNFSSSSAVYGKVGTSDVRAASLVQFRYSQALTPPFRDSPARMLIRLTRNSLRAVAAAAYGDAVEGNISTWA